MRTADARVKIAYFVPPSGHFAGVERVVHEIATGLAEEHSEALDVHVVYARRYDEAVLQDTAYTQHVLDVQRLRNLALAIRSCVARERFDVLVCPQVEPSVLTWVATRGLRLPVFLPHLHGNPRVEQARGTLSTRAAFAFFRRFMASRVSGVLAVSRSLERYAARALTPAVPVVYVPNPVRDFEAPDRGPSVGDPFQFISVARLSYQKGQDVLLHALALARPRLPPVRLTLVGSGPEEAALRALSTRLGLDDVVVFAGYTTDPDRHLVAADCFVLASRWEGFGVVLVEALRFGLPLLSTDCEFGPADVITDTAIGELVAPESPEALAEGLVRAAGRRDEPGDVARRRAAADLFSRSVVVAEHALVIRRFTAAARRP
ncbi:glycosyltransferase [Modestobacter muralis]|uniref:Glycosyltransferase n=1 Tax=Modestobacter muralis TaxID=1608614 RepID=A0A6P0EVK1_9ACTN|nr:glycosyltransferase [Modestobacter muralis]NEK94479.1 glycosyltransferase [Modestobacter muralis]NEN51367.1 glycosyltransferase [Modestobacter muralis]